jgi:hypothetical protein
MHRRPWQVAGVWLRTAITLRGPVPDPISPVFRTLKSKENDMGPTLCTFSHLAASLRRWLRLDSPAALTRPTALRGGLHTAAGRGHVAWPPAAAQPRRPLRVLRVVDAGHGPSTAGRMVISGRMADVCAELDRLAALEACGA